MTQKLVSYLTFILFLIPFALLIVDNNVLFPFITTKALFFRILVSIGLVFALWLYLLNPKTFPKKNYLFLAIVLFFLANIISTILSVNPYRSFWGNAERMEGLWSLFFYLAYFFLLFTLFQFNPQAKKTIFYSILIVTTLISIIEIQQAFSFNQERPSATLGNPTYIGFLNLLAIFLIIYFYFEAKDFQKYLYIFLIFLNLLSLIASQTRGSILGLLVGIIVFLFSYLIFSKIEIKKKLAFIGFAFIFLILFFFFLKTDIALKISGINRISETLQNPVSIFPRLYAWKIFLNAFLKKPVFGWGQETMPIAFFSNFDPQIFNYEQAIFDRPHNKFIEILASTGVVGFLTWLLIFLAFIYYVFKLDLNLYQKSTLLAFIFSYLAQNFSLFDMQASYTLFFFGLALVAPKVEFKEAEDKFIRPYLILFSGLFLIYNIFILLEKLLLT
jgi:O-antigen ligase